MTPTGYYSSEIGSIDSLSDLFGSTSRAEAAPSGPTGDQRNDTDHVFFCLFNKDFCSFFLTKKTEKKEEMGRKGEGKERVFMGRPQKIGQETDYIMKISVTLQTNGSLDLCVYPCIGFDVNMGPDNSAFLINIHEPIIWRIHEMIPQVNFGRLKDTQATAVSVDPIIQIGVLNISEVRLKVSMTMSPSQRPGGVLGFWASLMTALENTENMTVKINQRFHENVCMRQSTMISNAIANIKKDLLGVAALSMNKKFIEGRQRQESKGVDDLGSVIREGGRALAKGMFRGVTGILKKPIEGAKSAGVESFVQGVGKGIIGVAGTALMWDVPWDDLATMELTQGKKDHFKAPPSQLILYLKTGPTDTKEQVRIIKCTRYTDQALQVYSSIERAMITYGQNSSKELLKKKVTKPYSPVSESNAVEVDAKEEGSTWCSHQVPSPKRPTFGASSNSLFWE
ncbi:hypothetical protein F3Y22_tig00009105pilonHSYRG00018 [Hibiscus syriacus]|uniref:Uncharacterized protein n=1 Tax=Hibiscus syriacus TaxID=106335 RepID=A0A6A3C748_HIBSY|nr:hypothetical protein F3Y22_tig00009105pilonHSYRG00018 [Hibiscus syriacus]